MSSWEDEGQHFLLQDEMEMAGRVKLADSMSKSYGSFQDDYETSDSL